MPKWTEYIAHYFRIFNSVKHFWDRSFTKEQLMWELQCYDPRNLTIANLKKAKDNVKREMKLVMAYAKEQYTLHPFVAYRTGEYDVMWRFQGDPKALECWTVTTDKDELGGFSYAKFEMSQSGRGVFSGYLDRTLPKDGKVKKSGVVNLKSPYKFVGFQRRVPYDWSEYNTMRMRVRGDGRTYYLHLKLHFRYQDFQADNFSYPLHTRGGPYWQEVQIPFSRFMLNSAGTIQDMANPYNFNNILCVSISLADRVNGPFKLELDYIALENNEHHKEIVGTAYEAYRSNVA